MGLSIPCLDECTTVPLQLLLLSRIPPPPPLIRSFGTFKLLQLLLLFPVVDDAVLLDDVIPLSRVWLRLFWLCARDPSTTDWLNLPLLPLLFVIKLLLFVAPLPFSLLIDRIEPEEEQRSTGSPPPD